MRKLFALLLSLIPAAPIFSQGIIQVETPNVVGLDEQFNVTFIIEGEKKVSDFSWTPGSDFQLVWGPQKGSSTSINMVNGKTTRSVQSTYTYVLLPKAVGKFVLNAASAKVDGNEVTSSTPTVEVVTNGASSSSRSQPQSSGGNSSSSQKTAVDGDVPSDDLFMRFSLSRTNVVIGEPITATLKLYQSVNVAGFEDAKFPTFNGFWSQETEAPTNIEFKRESLNDRIYNTAVLRKWVLIPQQSGPLRIDPAELVVLVNVMTQRKQSTSIFDSFFDSGYRTVRKRITTPAVTVNVKALPAGAPASFGGGVGNFSISAKLSRDSLKTHEAASLIVTLTGKGNVALLEAPKINFPPDFEVYDTKTSQKTDKSTGGTSGSKSFEYPFIPRSHGDFTIGPIQYSYYDVNSGKYNTLTAPEMELHVERSSGSEGASQGGTLIQMVEHKGVKNLGEDIRFISTKKPALDGGLYFFVASPAYWIVLLILTILAAAVWFSFRKVAARKADVAGARNRAATKMARKRLKAAGDYLAKDLYTAFYEELHKALLGFASDKLYLGMEELDKDRIAAKFVEGGVAEDIAARFSALLDACEYARYSPAAGHEAMSAHYEEAVGVISIVDSGMKGKKSGLPKSAAIMGLALLFLFPTLAAATDERVDSLWTAGVDAYNEGLWDVAVSSWEAISDMGIDSGVLFYNIGNAYFRDGYTAKAILWYERALKADPSYSEARFNLEFANEQIQDRIDPVPEFMLKSLARKVSYSLGSNLWSVVSLILFAAMLVMLLVFLLAPGRGSRKTGFFTALVLLLLTLGCFGLAEWQKVDYLRRDGAIVMSPVASVKSSPSADSAKDLFVLHEGTKVTVLDEVGGWKNIELSDGRQGWIKSGDIEVI